MPPPPTWRRPRVPIFIAIVSGMFCVALGLAGAPVDVVGFDALCFGMCAVLAYGWSLRQAAIHCLQRLPFRIVHDRPDALDASAEPRDLLSISIVLQTPADIDVTPPRQPRSVRELAQLLSTWGLELHAKYGVAEVNVRWARRKGPPLSL